MKRLQLPLVIAVLVASAHAQDIVVHCGETATLDGVVDSLIVERGGVLSFTGVNNVEPARVRVRRGIRIEGVLDVSGEDAHPVRFQGAGWLQQTGGIGGPAGSNGGAGNPRPGVCNPKGGDGLHLWTFELNGQGGFGGESAFFPSTNPDSKRPGGGGGARLASDQPLTAFPYAPENLGLIATDGKDGSIQANGAIGGIAQRPRGGPAGPSVFTDTDPRNDFWGRGFDLTTHLLVIGELATPIGGRGGGGGGDSYTSSSFPVVPWSPPAGLHGAGGGGGGGLVYIVTPRLEIVGEGVIRSNGGDGARGASTGGDNCVGGGSGAGSGGMIVIQASTIDLRAASTRCITALGGRGGFGKYSMHDVEGAGGNGGPGIVQLHVPNGPADILLPVNRTLLDMTAPAAWVLLPQANL